MDIKEKAPFYEEILRYAQNPAAPFHTPGHRAGRSLGREWLKAKPLLELDLTEITGLDWERRKAEAEEAAAELYRADRSFFLVQGATQGIITALLGSFNPGDSVLVARNCHTAVINGIILADLDPVFVATDFIPSWGLALGPRISSLREALRTHPDAKGLIITNPTYQGIATRLDQYRRLIGDRILLVDEAHGGHLGWCGFPDFDAWREADIWVQGTHKFLGSLTQTGILHLKKGRVNEQLVQRRLELITTTSQSFILLASLDANRRFLASAGKRLYREKLPATQQLKTDLAGIDGVKVLGPPLVGAERLSDPWKIALSLLDLGLTGSAAEKILSAEFHIQPEYADRNQVLFIVTPWQEPRDLVKLKDAVAAVARKYRGKPLNAAGSIGSIPSLAIKPREAVFGPLRPVKLAEAVGRISATVIAPYPPGIPVIVPGEIIRPEEVELIENIIGQGGEVKGLNYFGEIFISRKEEPK